MSFYILHIKYKMAANDDRAANYDRAANIHRAANWVALKDLKVGTKYKLAPGFTHKRGNPPIIQRLSDSYLTLKKKVSFDGKTIFGVYFDDDSKNETDQYRIIPLMTDSFVEGENLPFEKEPSADRTGKTAVGGKRKQRGRSGKTRKQKRKSRKY